MSYRLFAFARNWWRRKRNTPRSTRSTPRKSSVMKGSTMAFIGKRLRANRRAPSGRWWHRPLPRVWQELRGPSDSLPRLLFSHPRASVKEWPREELHREWQNDRGLRFRGLSGGIQVVGRDDIHR